MHGTLLRSTLRIFSEDLVRKELTLIYGANHYFYGFELSHDKIEIKKTDTRTTCTDEEILALGKKQKNKNVKSVLLHFHGFLGPFEGKEHRKFKGDIRYYSTDISVFQPFPHYVYINMKEEKGVFEKREYFFEKVNLMFVFKNGIIDGHRTKEEKVILNPCEEMFLLQPGPKRPKHYEEVFGGYFH